MLAQFVGGAVDPNQKRQLATYMADLVPIIQPVNDGQSLDPRKLACVVGDERCAQGSGHAPRSSYPMRQWRDPFFSRVARTRPVRIQRMNLGTGLRRSRFINRFPPAMHAPAALRRRKFLERIKNLQAGPAKVFVVSRRNRQTMTAGSGSNVSIFQGHSLSVLFQQVFLIGPDVGNRNVEAEDASAERVHQSPQPVLELTPLTPFLGPHPIRQFCDDDRTGEAPVPFLV